MSPDTGCSYWTPHWTVCSPGTSWPRSHWFCTFPSRGTRGRDHQCLRSFFLRIIYVTPSPPTYRVGLILQQRNQHISGERHGAVIQSALHLRVDQPAHLSELPLRPLALQEPSNGSSQDTVVYLHEGLSLEEAAQHEGCQPMMEKKQQERQGDYFPWTWCLSTQQHN